LSVLNEIRVRKEYKGQSLKDRKRAPMSNPCDNEDISWRQYVGTEPVKAVQVGPLPSVSLSDNSSTDGRISSSKSDNDKKASNRKSVTSARTISAMYKLSIGNEINNANSNSNSNGNSNSNNSTNSSNDNSGNDNSSNSSVSSNRTPQLNNSGSLIQTARTQPSIESEDDMSTSNSTNRAVVAGNSKKMMKLSIDMRKKNKLLIQTGNDNNTNSPGKNSYSPNSYSSGNATLDEKVAKLSQAKVIKAYLKYNPASPEFSDLLIDATTTNGNSSSNLHAHLLSKVFPDTLSVAFNNDKKKSPSQKDSSSSSIALNNSHSNSSLTRLGKIGLGITSTTDLKSLIIDNASNKKKVSSSSSSPRPSSIPRISSKS
jgi:hypothetical protein